MNVNKKAASLYQSMDLWIALYRRIHECDHNTAHDAFDEWADALKGESADQSTPQFHEAVHTSYEAMLAEAPKEVETPLVHHNHSVSKRIFAPGSFDKAVHDDVEVVFNKEPVPNLVGGPILETGYDPLSFKDSYKEENTHWGQKTVVETDLLALEDRAVKELLGYGNPMPRIDTVEEARKKAENAIEVNTSFLINTKHPHDHQSVVKAREVIAAARIFLVMLGGVEERTEQRKSTGRLSLKKG